MKIKELERKLKVQGCYFMKHGNRHDLWFSPITNSVFPIPRHGAKEVPDGTLDDIIKQSGIVI